MTYTYERPAIANLQRLQAAVEYTVGVRPEGCSSGAETSIDFANPLTPTQEAALATLMQGSGPDTIPAITGTAFHAPTIAEIRTTVDGLGFPHVAYPAPSGPGYTIQFLRALTPQERTAVQTALRNLFATV